jgi:hypothetical protein
MAADREARNDAATVLQIEQPQCLSGFSASSAGQAATQRNPLHSLRFLPSSRETATQAQTGDAYVTSEVLYQLSYVGDRRRAV